MWAAMWMMVAAAGVGLAAPQAVAKRTTQPTSHSARGLVEINVDPRVELFSLIFKLAGNEEYSRTAIQLYDESVEKRFGSLRNQPVVKLARRLRAESGMGFDAPMSLAMHVSAPPELKELVPLDPWPEGLDGRWKIKTVREFLAEARKFAVEQRFQEFVEEQRAMYEIAADRARSMIETGANLQWFEEYFGPQPDIRFHIYLGLLNGPSNYGARVCSKDGQDNYCILGVWHVDGKGMPAFPGEPFNGVVPTVIHEFAHSYMNPLVNRHAHELQAAGEALFAPVADQMQQMAYGNWQTMLCESMVRVTVVRYRYANEGPLMGMAEASEQRLRGFAWMPELSGLMLEYERDRAEYATMVEFLPRVVEFFNQYAKRTGTTLPSQ